MYNVIYRKLKHIEKCQKNIERKNQNGNDWFISFKQSLKRKERKERAWTSAAIPSFFTGLPWTAFLSVNGIKRHFFADSLVTSHI